MSQQDVDLIKSKFPDVTTNFLQRDILDGGKQFIVPDNGTSAVCLDLSVIKAQYAPGVSEPSAVMGFTPDDIKSMI